MAFEERDQSGALFKNTQKQKDNQPDYQGKAIVNGQPVYVSAWLKDGKSGKFLSLAFKNREAGSFEKKPPQADQSVGKPVDDQFDVPF